MSDRQVTVLKKWMSVLAALCVILATAVPSWALGSADYVSDNSGKAISIPQTHRVTRLIRDFGKQGGLLSQPSDLFVDEKDQVYIADSGNNRIVKLDANGNFLTAFDCGGTLSQPGGVFVSKSGDLYIADTLNERIVHLSEKGEYIEEFGKPESEMLDENATFQISRIGLTEQGYLYTIRGQYFMMIDANNEFKGYVGDNHLGFSLTRLLIRTFASKEQQSKLIKEAPTSYSSFDIGKDGMIYATTGEDASSGQIQKINMVGENIYPVRAYGERYFNTEIKRYVNPRLVDITVNKNGILYAVDAYSCHIFSYDQEGNMLAVFGGSGNIKGKFSDPIALDTMSNGELWVLDKATGYIHVFAPTSFMNAITQAVKYYDDGKYEEACNAWKSVLQVDVNYPVANKGIGDALYKQKRTEEAMEYYRLADSKSGYGTAFSVYRYGFFRAHFGIIVLIVAVLATVTVLLIVFFKKRADKTVKDYYAGGKGDA